MRIPLLVIMAALAAGGAAAQDLADISRIDEVRDASVDPEPASMSSVYTGPRTKVSMWIWSDKYTYSPGQALTLKWTVKTNNDLYPYTILVYRQYNRTGAKTYFPGGVSDPVDINGNTLAQGFQPVQLTDVTKGVLMGPGGRFPALTLPNELGMHTIVVQLRDYTGTRVLKTAYMKIGVVSTATTISGDITASRTLTNDTEWRIAGIVYVKNGATLTVEPGTFVFGQPGTSPPSAIIVTQNGKIIANGTKSQPIIMTSSQPFGQRIRGDWGGLVLLGKAPINVGGNTTGGVCPAGGCQNAPGTFYIEGLVGNPDSLYGGTDPKHNCGSLKYVRVEYAGTILSPNNELNSFTWGGCGTDTVAEHLQAIYGKDDNFEWFGGTMNAKWLIGGLAADDGTDYQLGYTGKVQFGIIYESPDSPGNRGIEGDNSEYNQAAEPFSNPTFFNISYFGVGTTASQSDEANAAGIFLRRGSRGSFNNLLVSNFVGPCLDINDPATPTPTQAQADLGNITMNGILCWRNNRGGTAPADTLTGNIPTNNANGTFSNAYAQGLKGNGAGKNFLVADPLAARPFQFSDPDFSGLFGSPIFRTGWVAPPDDGFFDQSAKFIGGIGDEDWTEEWTSWLVEQDVQ